MHETYRRLGYANNLHLFWLEETKKNEEKLRQKIFGLENTMRDAYNEVGMQKNAVELL